MNDFSKLKFKLSLQTFKLSSSAKIIFVCGKDINNTDAARSDFLKYAKKIYMIFYT